MAIFHLRVTTARSGAGRASRHAEYVDRVGQYEDRQDLVHSEKGNMPEWAEENQYRFWQESDQRERVRGSAYRDLEIALPRELTHEQQKVLVHWYVNDQLGTRHAYQWAIHDKGDGNPHVHIMFSERMDDGRSRSPEQYFKRYNAKNPEKGGCKKDNSWGAPRGQTSQRLLEARFAWQEHANRAFERAGIEARIDHRSLKAQGVEREPQIHVGFVDPAQPEIRAERLERNEEIKSINQLAKQEPEAQNAAEQAMRELKEANRALALIRGEPVRGRLRKGEKRVKKQKTAKAWTPEKQEPTRAEPQPAPTQEAAAVAGLEPGQVEQTRPRIQTSEIHPSTEGLAGDQATLAKVSSGPREHPGQGPGASSPRPEIEDKAPAPSPVPGGLGAVPPEQAAQRPEAPKEPKPQEQPEASERLTPEQKALAFFGRKFDHIPYPELAAEYARLGAAKEPTLEAAIRAHPERVKAIKAQEEAAKLLVEVRQQREYLQERMARQGMFKQLAHKAGASQEAKSAAELERRKDLAKEALEESKAHVVAVEYRLKNDPKLRADIEAGRQQYTQGQDLHKDMTLYMQKRKEKHEAKVLESGLDKQKQRKPLTNEERVAVRKHEAKQKKGRGRELERER